MVIYSEKKSRIKTDRLVCSKVNFILIVSDLTDTVNQTLPLPRMSFDRVLENPRNALNKDVPENGQAKVFNLSAVQNVCRKTS